MRIRRLLDRPDLDPTIGVNIQGPSMILVPDWIGDYYLYFADHKGSYIRLAYADHPEGPWRVHKPRSLHLAQIVFSDRTPGRLAGTGVALRRASAQARHPDLTMLCRRSRRRISPPPGCPCR